MPSPIVALAAPTGKAATRLAEAVHGEALTMDVEPAVRDALLATTASTLHRLLGWQPGNRTRFRYDVRNQLPHSVVIVDETSMVSLSMMARLLSAVRPEARLVLVGDPRQLASVEAGAVLGDIVGPATSTGSTLASGIVMLRKVHRFEGGIAAVAQAIEAGDSDGVMAAIAAATENVTWIDADPSVDPRTAPELADVRSAIAGAAAAVVDAASAGDGEAALKRLRTVQLLCAHRRGPFGATRWRAEIEHWLRAVMPGHGSVAWYPGRPLLVTENDYGLGVFNGDTGVVIDAGGGRLRAVFERRGGILEVRPTRLASVESLYAMTIHKAQGSQFGSVIVVLPESTSRVLSRELLYTAVTRAQAHCTIVASEAAIRAAVDRPIARASGLGDALWPVARSSAVASER
jgi:exodeoxyribonuclease V alpha subunit